MAKQLRGVAPHVGSDLLTFFLPFDNVDLVENEDDLLAPLADLLEYGAFALGEGSVGGSDEEDQVGAGDEVSRQLFVSADDGIRSRRVDQGDLTQQVRRVGPFEDEGLEQLLAWLLAVAQQVDPVGGGCHAFGQHPLAQQGVDEGGLAGVELAGDDQ
jgi:hypothetical protein